MSNTYRTHGCGDMTTGHVGQTVRVSGWIHRQRDHGGLLFLDVRDHTGLLQCVVTPSNPHFAAATDLRVESVVTLEGELIARDPRAVRDDQKTGAVELVVKTLTVQSTADVLPFQVNTDQEVPEELRLRYRFLDLRRDAMRDNLLLRSNVIAGLRRRMIAQGFQEIHTPILTSSSPEGARDFLVPSRLYPGEFYALPQAPQQFKQLLMVAGIPRYFQIAPCFRDEASRADRSPGEFYQLDFEMAFATQDDVFAAIEPVLHGVFEEFGRGQAVTPPPFPRIPYQEAMLRYGSDKPDLRNPLEIRDATDLFRDSTFAAFQGAIAKGAVVRALAAPGGATQPRSWFDKLNEWARAQGAGGLAYVQLAEGAARGGISKFLDAGRLAALKELTGAGDGDAVFFVCDQPGPAAKLAGLARTRLGEDLKLIDPAGFRFCWIVDFPMYERNPDTNQIEFSHNPFSMPQGGMEALRTMDPLDIKAYQYDIVCNGVELSSGAIRNHRPDIMLEAFRLAGYTADDVEKRFGGMLQAFRYGAPPHGGSAPGVERIVMLLAGQPNIREVVAFPMNQNARDLLMNAPSPVLEKQLQELHLRVVLPPPKKA